MQVVDESEITNLGFGRFAADEGLASVHKVIVTSEVEDSSHVLDETSFFASVHPSIARTK